MGERGRVIVMTTFETQLAAMKASIRSRYSKKVAALMLPDDAAERITHAACEMARTACSCRVCYWVKR